MAPKSLGNNIMSAQMDGFVTAGIEGIEVVQGKPNVLSPLIHTFPTE